MQSSAKSISLKNKIHSKADYALIGIKLFRAYNLKGYQLVPFALIRQQKIRFQSEYGLSQAVILSVALSVSETHEALYLKRSC